MHQILQYSKLGFEHISDINGYDHILFVSVVCAFHTFKEWKQLACLVTAFTLGHSISLALSVFGFVNVNSRFVEVLIPVTILLTCVFNSFMILKPSPKSSIWSYFLTLGFGLIHGLGFSSFFKAIFSNGMDIVMPLISFNVGLEIGQLGIVLMLLILKHLVSLVYDVNVKYWVWGISGICGIMATFILIERI